jgi:hypothetical protein
MVISYPIIVSESTVRPYETAMAAELLEQEFSIKRVLQSQIVEMLVKMPSKRPSC